MKRWLLGGLGWLMIMTPLTRADDAPRIVAVEKDVVYGTIDGKQLKLDLARPKQSDGPLPTLICIHGGAWQSGDRSQLSRRSPFFNNQSFIERLAAQGFLAASVSYRLSGEAKWPAQIVDCKTAVRFLRAHANRFNLNTKKFGAVGFSAGGHLAMLLGLMNGQDGLEGELYPEHASRVQAVVNFFGPCDLADYGKRDPQSRVFLRLFGKSYTQAPELWETASPLCYARKDAAPVLFLHGTKDQLVPINQSRTMDKKLRELGVESKLIELKGENHGWVGKPAERTLQQTIAFFAEKLK